MLVAARSWRRRLPILFTLALALAACGGGDEAATDPGGDAGGAPSASNEVAIDGFMFMPDSIEVPAGTTVTWTNQEAPEHSIQDGADLFPESEALGQGMSFSFTYDTPGSYPYVCGIHPYMKGTVVVS